MLCIVGSETKLSCVSLSTETSAKKAISALSARFPEVHPLLTTLLHVGPHFTEPLQSPIFLVGYLLYGVEWPSEEVQ